ncbi:MAG: ABC transporter permease [Planctomycetota bacterium]
MFAGPLFARELIIVSRGVKHFLLRAGYVLGFFLLIYTAEKAVIGFEASPGPGPAAAFGQIAFRLLAFLETVLLTFFAIVSCSGRVSQEKDRGTLVLLLMTDLSDASLVGGKLASGLLTPVVLALIGLPALAAVARFGGVEQGQIVAASAVALTTACAAGAWGTLVAFWREKTFQTLAVGLLGPIAWVLAVEGLLLAVPSAGLLGGLDPLRALWAVTNPLAGGAASYWAAEAALAGGLMAGLAAVFFAVATNKVRVWNPSRVIRGQATAGPVEAADGGSADTALAPRTATARDHRQVWDSPITWRELCTRAYGKKTAVIKAVVILLVAVAAAAAWRSDPGELVYGLLPPAGVALVGVAFLGVLLINAQAVTSLTSERDGRTLELLLATEITPADLTAGKLLGIAWNMREAFLGPVVVAVVAAARGALTPGECVSAVFSYLALAAFAAMVGLHSAGAHRDSRTAISASLGTVFFLLAGNLVFLLLLVEARGSFALQFQGFLIFIVAGGVGLGAALNTGRSASALWLAASLLPFLTFYAAGSFLLGDGLASTLAVVAAYGFASVAMLIPATSEFGVAAGAGRG